MSCEKGKKILEVKHLNAGRMVRDINLELYEGEIVGIAGLMGAGRTETTRAIFGIDPKESGEIFIDGKEVKISCPADSIKAGLVLAPEDRKKTVSVQDLVLQIILPFRIWIYFVKVQWGL